MWQTLRAEISYSRPVIFAGLGIALGVGALVSVILHLVGDQGPPDFFLPGFRGMCLIMAPVIGAFVIQGGRLEERRTRLLFSGPLTPAQLAGVSVLLPVVLFAIGAATAGLWMGAEAAITGRLTIESLQLVGYVGGLLFMMTLVGLLVQEAVVAGRERRIRAAVLGWAAFALAVLPMAVLPFEALTGSLTWTPLNLANLFGAGVAAVATVALYTGRTDFTR